MRGVLVVALDTRSDVCVHLMCPINEAPTEHRRLKVALWEHIIKREGNLQMIVCFRDDSADTIRLSSELDLPAVDG